MNKIKMMEFLLCKTPNQILRERKTHVTFF
jgi:hypothetical protein